MSDKAKKVIRILTKVFLIAQSVLKVFLIYPIILAFFAYHYIDDDTKENAIKKLVFAILLIAYTPIPTSSIGGTLMLIDAIANLAKFNKEEKKIVDVESKPVEEK